MWPCLSFYGKQEFSPNYNQYSSVLWLLVIAGVDTLSFFSRNSMLFISHLGHTENQSKDLLFLLSSKSNQTQVCKDKIKKSVSFPRSLWPEIINLVYVIIMSSYKTRKYYSAIFFLVPKMHWGHYTFFQGKVCVTSSLSET